MSGIDSLGAGESTAGSRRAWTPLAVALSALLPV